MDENNQRRIAKNIAKNIVKMKKIMLISVEFFSRIPTSKEYKIMCNQEW